MKIEICGEVIEVHKPIGRMGAVHFGLMSKAIPDHGDTSSMSEEDLEVLRKKPLSPEERSKLMEVFEEWSSRVLPNIVVGGPEKYKQLSGEQQFGIFMALMQSSDIAKNPGEDIFRIIQ